LCEDVEETRKERLPIDLLREKGGEGASVRERGRRRNRIGLGLFPHSVYIYTRDIIYINKTIGSVQFGFILV